MKLANHVVAGILAFGLTAVASAGDNPGKQVYESTCIACHGADGSGVLPGVPDLTDRNGRLSKSDGELLDNILNGFQSPGSPMAMPAKGGNPSLSEADIQAVIVYMRAAFGT